MISLFCEELKTVKDFLCCAGCHQKDESGSIDFYVANFNIDGQSVFVHGCCAAHVCCFKGEELRPAIEMRLKKIEKINEVMKDCNVSKPDETDADFRERILKRILKQKKAAE